MRLTFLLIYFEANQHFCLYFSDDDDNDEFTLGDAVLFVWKKRENRLEHAYVVTVWALSLQPAIQADCMEQ